MALDTLQDGPYLFTFNATTGYVRVDAHAGSDTKLLEERHTDHILAHALAQLAMARKQAMAEATRNREMREQVMGASLDLAQCLLCMTSKLDTVRRAAT